MGDRISILDLERGYRIGVALGFLLVPVESQPRRDIEAVLWADADNQQVERSWEPEIGLRGEDRD
jgi:hypothetical protein